MKKSIFLFFAAILCAIGMNAETYRYSGEKDGWAGTQMTVSSDGYYSYYGPVKGAHQFKIGTSSDQWAYNHSYVSKGFNSTDITDLGDYGKDNAFCWSSSEHYILVYHPSTKINSSSKVKICASTFLPDDSETDLPEPEPEPTELTYNVTVPAGTNVCYICGNMTGWKFTEMTKVDDTHYTITIEGAKKDDGYKYASGSDWGYVEKDANGNEIGNRTYVDGNDVVAKWAAVYEPDAVEQELTYNVTVPAGTYACYIAMDSDPAKDGWEFTAMTKVDETHYTFTRTGLKNKTYKYASGPSWDYVEKTSENGDVADRQWAENDVVAKWQAVYDPTPIYNVTVTAENGTITGAGEYKEGTEVTLTATAAEGYEFVNWTVLGEEVSTENPYTFVVSADLALVANFQEVVVEPEYEVIEAEITNLEIDLESMCIIGGPSSPYAVDVFLILTEQNPDGTWALSAEESSVAISGVDATFIDGYAYDIDVDAPAVKVVLHVEFGGTKYELQIDMTSKPVVIEIADAIVSKEEYPDGMGGTYTNWTMDGQWSDGETTYPVLVDMPAFDPTVAEADITVTIQIGSWLDVFYGAAEGLVHATVAENVVTLTGTLTSHTAGTWEVSISGTLPADEPEVPTALDNVDTTVAPAKAIVNGQLVIIKNGVQYNAQGAVVK